MLFTLFVTVFLCLLLYTVRSALCFASRELLHYNTLICQTFQQILNIQFGDETWHQSTLPVSLGGLGVRSATDLALPTFLASVTAKADYISQLLTSHLHHITDPAVINMQNAWTSLTCATSPSTFQQCTEIMGLASTEV